MHEHPRAPAVELVEERIEDAIAQIDAATVGQQHDTVGAEPVERVLELHHRAVEIRQAQSGEEAEPIGSAAHHVRRVLVHRSRPLPRFDVVAEVNARRRHRQDRGLDPEAVHGRERGVAAPVGEGEAPGFDAPAAQPLRVVGWDDVEVSVDPSGVHRVAPARASRPSPPPPVESTPAAAAPGS